MHFGAAECLVVGFLTGGHLDQRRACEEHLGAFLDHHDVIGHARDVRTAGRRVTEDQCNGGDSGCGQLSEVTEHPATGNEHLFLRRQVCATGLDERDHRKAILHRDVVRAESLTQRPWIAGAAAHGGIVGDDQAFDAFDDADTDHGAGADREVAPPRSEGAQFEKR